jgi:predicted PurR-regulated permease PerM
VIIPAGLAFNKLTTIAIVVAMIYFSREILVPIALAVLLSFVLAPLVKILQRGHLPRPLAVIFAVASALAVTISLTVMVMVQVNQLAKDLPRYQVTLSEKIHNLRDMLGPSVLFRDASSILKDLSKELEAPDLQQAASAPPR